MYDRIIKRCFDLLLTLLALPVLGLVTLVIAVLVKLDDKGPVFYNAMRVGRDGRPYKMYKYRTMIVNAPDLKMADGSTYNAADDPRQTKVGRWLRSTSLDELPQIINILKGDMSFIGPRPDLQEEVELYQGDEGIKLRVRPGISGHAQVNGRNAIAWRQRLALDVYYVQHQGLALDASIFFKTFAVVFLRKDIYVEPGQEQGQPPKPLPNPLPKPLPKPDELEYLDGVRLPKPDQMPTTPEDRP
jgi:lipopolysaccharide/colanic/teichoic acid biosynthesis glycosyltransferase